MNKSPCLCSRWMYTQVNNQTRITDEKNLQYHNELTTNRLELVLHREQNQGLSPGEVCWKLFCILALVLIYES